MNEEQNKDTKELNKNTEEALSKIAITKEADRALNEALNRVNDGFEAGKATKIEVTSYIILNYVKACTEANIHAMRTQFFNPILVLESMVRKAKETGALPDDVRQYLYEQFMASGTQSTRRPAKKSNKTLKDNANLDSILTNGDAA